MPSPPESSRATRLAVGLAGVVAGAVLGLCVGCYLAAFNPVAGFGPRLLLITTLTLSYALSAGLILAGGGVLGVVVGERLPGARDLVAKWLDWASPGRAWLRIVGILLVLACGLGLLRGVQVGDTRLDFLPPAPIEPNLFLVLIAALALPMWFSARAWSLGRALVVLASVGTVVALVLAALPHFAESGAPRNQALAAVSVTELQARPPSLKVAILGFDGLDPLVVERMIDRGLMPTFAQVREDGVLAPLQVLPNGFSPPTWTTLATGVVPSEHGVFDFIRRPLLGTSLDLAGLPTQPRGLASVRVLEAVARTGLAPEDLVLPGDWRAPALWSMSSIAKIETCVVDWMFTWPADEVFGTAVSDRAFFAHNLGLGSENDRGRADQRTVSKRLEEHGDEGAEAARQGLCSPQPNCLQDLPFEDHTQRVEPSAVHAFHMAEDRFFREAARRTFARNDCQLAMFYSHLPDFLNHSRTSEVFQGVLDGGDPHLAGADFVTVYEEVDRTLALLLETLGEDFNVMVVSDHGVTVREIAGQARVTHGYPGPDGVFLFRPGSGFGGWTAEVTPSVYDVVPTALALLGLPQIEGQPGRPLFGVDEPLRVISPDVVQRQTSVGREELPEMSEDVLERLRSLGYIQ